MRLLALLLGLMLLRPAPAQERIAHVRLDDGTELTGRVLDMSLDSLRLQVGEEVVTIGSNRIRGCNIDRAGESAVSPGASVAPVPDAEAQAPAVANVPDAQAPEKKPAGKVTWTGPLPDPVDAEAAAQLPLDVHALSRWRQRLGALDAIYPWLVPSAPAQWWSIGLLLAVGLSLIVHLSANVAGGEAVSLSRSTGLGLWYLVTGLIQFAFVPVNDLSIVLMLLGNTTAALFALCSLFGLPRFSAVVAFAVQLGCLVICYGVLELVTSLLASTGAIM